MAGHVAPEAAVGGPIGLIRDGDTVVLDVDARLLEVELDDARLQARRSDWRPRAPTFTSGVMAKYARLVSSAALGAVTAADA